MSIIFVSIIRASVTASLLLIAAVALAADRSAAPTYTTDGRLELPADYREWIFLSSGLDMNYNEKPDKSGHSVFSNVFVNPAAYQEFIRTGSWPDPTVLVMDLRTAGTKGSINKHGKFQRGKPLDIEVHVKDLAHLTGGWGFFEFDGTEPAAQIPAAAPCYGCHRQHAAVDTTFVQFYPTLLEIAMRKGTLSPSYEP